MKSVIFVWTRPVSISSPDERVTRAFQRIVEEKNKGVVTTLYLGDVSGNMKDGIRFYEMVLKENAHLKTVLVEPSCPMLSTVFLLGDNRQMSEDAHLSFQSSKMEDMVRVANIVASRSSGRLTPEEALAIITRVEPIYVIEALSLGLVDSIYSGPFLEAV